MVCHLGPQLLYPSDDIAGRVFHVCVGVSQDYLKLLKG